MARPFKRYVCQSCGAVTSKWSGRCETCGEWNTIVEEVRPGARTGRRRAGARRERRLLEFAGLRGTTPQPERYRSGIAEFDRVCGGGLVPGSALLIGGDPGIGKSTLLLQVAAALATPEHVLRLHLRRGGDRPGPPARRAAGAGRRAGAARRRHLGARHRGHPRAARCAQGGGDRFDPDHVARHARQHARHRHPGPRLGPGAGRAGQAPRHRRAAGRPRHQGRRHRRPARARAHGRHGALFRGRARPSVPHPARGQEPLRPDRRDRRVRDVGPRPRRRRQPVGPVPRPSGAATSRAACVFAGIEGTRPVLVEIQALVAPSSFATPRRAVVGWDSEPAGHGAGRAGGALRRRGRRQRRLSQRRRRPAHRRAGGRPGGGGRGRLVPGRRAGAGRTWWCSARSAWAARSGRSASARRGCARPPSSASAAPSCRAAAPAAAPAPRPAEGIAIDEIEHLADLVARFQPAERAPKRTRREGASDRGRGQGRDETGTVG